MEDRGRLSLSWCCLNETALSVMNDAQMTSPMVLLSVGLVIVAAPFFTTIYSVSSVLL